MSLPSSPRTAGRVVAGVILISLGALFLLDNFGIVDARDVLRFWPLILIALGVTRLLAPSRPEGRVGGVVLLFLGSLFLLRALHMPWFHLRMAWPVLLVFLGGLLLWQALRRGAAGGAALGESESGARLPDGAGSDSGTSGAGGHAAEGARAGLDATRSPWNGAQERGSVLSEFALMGGGELVVRSQDFRGGEVSAIMGGFEIDLRAAAIAGDSATLELFTLFGGIELKVPQEWDVVIHGTPILGMFASTARPLKDPALARKTLVIKGTAIMGGVEVKN